MNHQFHSGTSGIALPEKSKKLFPQEFRDKSRLTYYATLFDSLEINSTFKKMPMEKTIVRWAANVPPDFKFTFKFPGDITHHKNIQMNSELVNHFFDVISNVGSKMGCVLIQFPGKLDTSRRKQVKDLLKAVEKVSRESEWNIALEFRNQSWYNRDIFDFILESKMTLVLHDLPPAPPPLIDEFDFIYLRFHGTEKGYRGSYTDEYLLGWAHRVTSWLQQGKDVYAYFNNTLGQAAQNLITLKKFINK